MASLAVTACSAPAGPAPAHRTEEQSAVLNWLAKTNAMWTRNDFAALEEITTAEMRTIYLAEQRGGEPAVQRVAAAVPADRPVHRDPVPARPPGRLRRLRRHRRLRPRPGHAAHGHGVPRVRWPVEAAAAVIRPAGGWPALCTQGAPPSAPPAARGRRLRARTGPGADARADRHRRDGRRGRAVRGQRLLRRLQFDQRPGRQAGRAEPRRGVSFTEGFTATGGPTLALPLAGAAASD